MHFVYIVSNSCFSSVCVCVCAILTPGLVSASKKDHKTCSSFVFSDLHWYHLDPEESSSGTAMKKLMAVCIFLLMVLYGLVDAKKTYVG